MMRHTWAALLIGGLIGTMGCRERPMQPPPDGTAPLSAAELAAGLEENLGVHAFPENTPHGLASWHTWRPSRHHSTTMRLGYAHGASAAAEVLAHLDSLAALVRYHDLGSGRYRWLKPETCVTPGLGCILTALEVRSQPNLRPVTRALRSAVIARQYSPIEAAEFLLQLVQAIPYEVPLEIPFGLLPPATVMSEKRGDCDSKSLLLSHLLSVVGIRSLLISSSAHGHTMLGIAVPTTGRTFEVGGTRYAYAETTAIGSPLGFIAPNLLTPDDWRTVPKPENIPSELVSLD